MIETLLIMAVLANPAATPAEPASCIKTSIDASGRTSKSKVIVSSGSKSHDRGALEFLRVMNFSRMPMGVKLNQTGHILVRATGKDSYTIDVTDARLLDSCPNGASAGA